MKWSKWSKWSAASNVARFSLFSDHWSAVIIIPAICINRFLLTVWCAVTLSSESLFPGKYLLCIEIREWPYGGRHWITFTYLYIIRFLYTTLFTINCAIHEPSLLVAYRRIISCQIYLFKDLNPDSRYKHKTCKSKHHIQISEHESKHTKTADSLTPIAKSIKSPYLLQ